MSVSLKIKNLERIPELFQLGLGARPSVRLILAVTGPVTKYFDVWEWGRVTCKPGPKTQWGVNPAGDTVVMTRTAPMGFIRVNRDRYREIIRGEVMKRLKWKHIPLKQIPEAIQWGLHNAAPMCADLIAETAPFDTYALREAIRAAMAVTDNEPVAVDIIAVRARVHL
jgi:hypothetical protein